LGIKISVHAGKGAAKGGKEKVNAGDFYPPFFTTSGIRPNQRVLKRKEFRLRKKLEREATGEMSTGKEGTRNGPLERENVIQTEKDQSEGGEGRVYSTREKNHEGREKKEGFLYFSRKAH